MKKLIDQIPKTIDAALQQFAGSAMASAQRLRWFFFVMFLLAALWNGNDNSAVAYIYPALALLWLVAALVFGRWRDLFILSLWIDLAIISTGLVLCAWQGVFNAKGVIIFLCYFPVLALAARRYNLLLVLQIAAFIAAFYIILSLWTLGTIPFPRLLAWGAMTVAAAALTRKPRAELVAATQTAVEEAYQAGAREKEAGLMAVVHEQFFPPTQYELPGLYTAYKHGVGTETSGDFYYAVETARGPLVVLGDLPGQGLDAAIAATRLQQSIITLTQEHVTLSDILTALNAILWSKGQTVTCILARWEGPLLHYVNAGHLPALHISKRHPEFLPVNALAVGSAEQLAFPEDVLEFPKGDLLLLYTNGAYAGLATEPDTGAAEMMRLVEQFGHGEVNTICHRVFDCGQPEYAKAPDDSTVVIVRRQDFAGETAA